MPSMGWAPLDRVGALLAFGMQTVDWSALVDSRNDSISRNDGGGD